MIPKFSIQLGGATSIDVTRPGIDKAYGVRKLHETLGIAIADMIFVGDAIFPGGNDYPAKQAGAESIRVRDPHETKRVIEAICACLETGNSHRQMRAKDRCVSIRARQALRAIPRKSPRAEARRQDRCIDAGESR